MTKKGVLLTIGVLTKISTLHMETDCYCLSMNEIRRRKLAIVLSSVGFHWEELAAAYRVFLEAKIQLQFFTPNGKPAVADPKSLIPRRLLDKMRLQMGAIDPRLLPIPFSNDGKLLACGARNSARQRFRALLNPRFFIVDPPFVTGVGPKAAGQVAEHMLRYLH